MFNFNIVLASPLFDFVLFLVLLFRCFFVDWLVVSWLAASIILTVKVSGCFWIYLFVCLCVCLIISCSFASLSKLIQML